VQVTEALKRKGELKMLALIECIRRYAEKCANYRASLAPGQTIEIDSLDPIVNELDGALVIIRTLEFEVFIRSDGLTFDAMRATSPGGQVVHALASLRDLATHKPQVIDPDIGRAVGPVGDGQFIIFPRWKRRSDLPSDTFIKQAKKTQAIKPYHTRVAAYDAHVSGRLVLDTLFDVFAFFDKCDPRLAPRADKQIVGFPIPPLPIVAGYYRMHPDWPTHEEVELEILARAKKNLPAGQSRTVVGTIADGSVVCGWTEMGNGGLSSFTEPSGQVADDIGRGYSYVIEADGLSVAAATDRLVVSDGRALTDAVPDVSGSATQPWARWWDLVSEHADLYANQRKGF
jgi:hypothetical protein